MGFDTIEINLVLFQFVTLGMISLLFTVEVVANAIIRASCPMAKTDLTNGLHVAIVTTKNGGKTKALLV